MPDAKVFPKDGGFQQISRLEVDELKIGGIVLRAAEGTRGANGRLQFQGVDNNSCELRLDPGPNCTTPGLLTQILMFAGYDPDGKLAGWIRHCFSWNRDSGGGILFNEDQGVSGDRVQPTWYRKTGELTFEKDGVSPRDGKTYHYGEDDGGRYIDAYFSDGSDEYYIAPTPEYPNGRRVALRSLIPAFVKYCEANGIPLEIR